MKSHSTTIIPNILLAVFLITTFTACHSDRRSCTLEQVGENRAELEKVLHHYKDDELKLQAAQFLIANMDAHYTLESPAVRKVSGSVGRNPEALFDGDALTFYYGYSSNNLWVGVEFEHPVRLSKVRFLPRNDDNFIREGETYQLY